MRAPRTSVRFAALLVAAIGVAVLLASTLASRSADDDKGIVANLLSRALSTPAARISIGRVDGALSSDITLHDLTIADRDGVWLRLDTARLVWSRSALLLSQRLEIDTLDVGHLQVLRRPKPAETEIAGSDQPLLPELPVELRVKAFKLEELALGAQVIGQAARLTANGAASLSDPSKGLDLHFDARRLDAAGDIALNLKLVPKTQALDLRLAAHEPAGGLVVHALHVPDLPPLALDLHGSGTLDAFRAQLAFAAGPEIGGKGTAQVDRSGTARRMTLALDARIAGLLPGPAAAVFAGTTRLDGTVDFADTGALRVAPVTLRSETAQLDVNGTLSPERIADLTVTAQALPNAGARTTAGASSIGKLAFDARVTGALAAPSIAATLDAHDLRAPQGGLSSVAAKFTTQPGGDGKPIAFEATAQAAGLAPADPALARALGSSLALKVSGAAQDGVADIKTAQVKTATAEFQFTGRVGRPELNGKLSLRAPDLGRFGELAGRDLHGVLAVNANLTGVPKDGRFAAAIAGRAWDVKTGRPALDRLLGDRLALDGMIEMLPHGGYAVHRLQFTAAHVNAHADAEAKLTDSAVDAQASLTGTVDGKPAKGAAHLAKAADGAWRLDGLDLQVGSARAHGALTLDAQGLAAGRLSLDARDLGDLSPVLLTKLSGSLKADAAFDSANGGQDGSVTAKGTNIKFEGSAIDRLSVDLKIADLYRRPVLDGTAAIDRARLGGEDVSQIRLTATPAGAVSTVALTARARGFSIDAHGKLVAVTPVRFDLAAFDARRGKHRIALARPASFVFDKGVGVHGLALALDGGRLTAEGRIGDTLDLALAAHGVPLSAAQAIAPDLHIDGTLDGDATIAGPRAAPTGAWRVQLRKLTAADSGGDGLPPVGIDASGRLAGTRTSLDARVSSKEAGTLAVSGTVPFDGNGLDLTARGALDLRAANARLSADGRHLAGTAKIELRLRGSFAKPAASGTATLAGGRYEDAVLGLRLNGIAAQIEAKGDTLRIARASAETPDGGTLSAEGDLRMDPAAGFPGSIRLTGRHARLAANDIATAVANLSLSLSGPLARKPSVSGRVDIVSLNVTIPERLPSSLSPLPGTEHVDAPPAVAARLAAKARAATRAQRGPAFDAALDLDVSAPNRVFVHGRGIDAELGGDLRLRGRLADPVTVGGFTLRRGRMSVAGTRLDFTSGRLEFAGSLVPTLNFVAETRTADITATITVTGPANAPGFAFSSTPGLPPEEILSRLLFAKASGGLSAGQALQVAQVAAQFSGGNGTDVYDRVRRALGVDSLDVSLGANGDPRVGVSRAINRRVSIGVKAGSQPGDSGVSVDVDVTGHIRAQGEVDRDGSTAVGIGMEWQY